MASANAPPPQQQQSQSATKRRGNFKLDTEDMERRLVEFRVNLDREKRRCQAAQMSDKFEKLLCDKLAELRDQCAGGAASVTGAPESELKLTSVDQEGMARLRNFLSYAVNKCGRIDQQELLQDVLRQSLQDTRRKRVLTQAQLPADRAPPLEPFCLFCASSFGTHIGPLTEPGRQGAGAAAAASAPAFAAPRPAPAGSVSDAPAAPGAHNGCAAHPPPQGPPAPPMALCAPPALERQPAQDTAACPVRAGLSEIQSHLYVPEMSMVVPNSHQEVTPPPSAATTPEVGEQAAGARPYTPPVLARFSQPQPRAHSLSQRQQQYHSQQPAAQQQPVTASRGQTTSNGHAPSAHTGQAQHQQQHQQQQQQVPQHTHVKQQITRQQQQQAKAQLNEPSKNTVTNASVRQETRANAPAQQAAARAAGPDVSQASNASQFVMCSDSDTESGSDSDANSIRHVLDQVNKSCLLGQTPELDQRRTSTPLSDADDAGADADARRGKAANKKARAHDATSSKLVIADTDVEGTITSQDEEDDEEVQRERSELYDFFNEDARACDSDQERPKVKLSRSYKLAAKSLKGLTADAAAAGPTTTPRRGSGGGGRSSSLRAGASSSAGPKSRSQPAGPQFVRIKKTNFVRLQSSPSSSSSVSSIGQHQAKFRAAMSQPSVSAGEALGLGLQSRASSSELGGEPRGPRSKKRPKRLK